MQPHGWDEQQARMLVPDHSRVIECKRRHMRVVAIMAGGMYALGVRVGRARRDV